MRKFMKPNRGHRAAHRQSKLSVAFVLGCLLVTGLFAGSVPAQTPTWLTSTHPCPGGNRTDALHRDNDGTLWVGCGTNAVGYGLFFSTDGGDGWQEAQVNPADALDEFRVSSITRGQGGHLYIAGFKASTREMVLRVTTTGPVFPVQATLIGVAQVGRQFHVGTYLELADGRAIAESLNGHDLLYRPSAAIGSSASDWTRVDGVGGQILNMVVHNDAFYGSGSTIAEPPRLYLPPTAGGAQPYEFVLREPVTSVPWEGELWGLAVNDQRLVAVGVDQDGDIGKILVSSADPYSAAGYSELSLPDIVGSGGIGTWARGVCMQDDVIVVVGERQPLGSATGLVMRSTNGGASFQNITPPGVTGSVSKCLIEPAGSIVVAGAAGFIGILESSPVIFTTGFEPQ